MQSFSVAGHRLIRQLAVECQLLEGPNSHCRPTSVGRSLNAKVSCAGRISLTVAAHEHTHAAWLKAVVDLVGIRAASPQRLATQCLPKLLSRQNIAGQCQVCQFDFMSEPSRLASSCRRRVRGSCKGHRCTGHLAQALLRRLSIPCRRVQPHTIGNAAHG